MTHPRAEAVRPTTPVSRGAIRALALVGIALVVTVVPLVGDDPKVVRGAVVAGVCLVLWLTEVVPLYATTLLLWVGIVTVLGPLDPGKFSLQRVLSAAANPVMALFFGGFALSAAGTRHGIDGAIARGMVRVSGGRRLGLLAAVMAGTAVLSMWMSNIAAAAMMLAALGPLFPQGAEAAPEDVRFRKACLLGVAFAADFGGIGTPIGTGPNLIAIGAVSDRFRVRFIDWMLFGVPLAVLMVAGAWGLLAWRYGVHGGSPGGALGTGAGAKLSRNGWAVVCLFAVAVGAWVSEPFHGVPAAVTALAVAAALFGTRLLDESDLNRLEWNTLLLIAGGITLGNLFHDAGIDAALAGSVNWRALPRPLLLLGLAAAAALISAVASNTAAAAMLVAIALGIDPSPSVAVVVAMGASMGVPFVISTPPNSMAYGSGGVSGRDFLLPGVVLMVAGCTLVAFTGPAVLRWLGIP